MSTLPVCFFTCLSIPLERMLIHFAFGGIYFLHFLHSFVIHFRATVRYFYVS